MRKCVFFDRDGVLIELINRGNSKYTSAHNIGEVIFTPDAQETVAKIKSLGYMAFIVTNQPGLVDGDMTAEECVRINDTVKSWLRIDDSRIAFKRGSPNYKPNPGMLKDLIQEHEIDVSRSYLIGDRWKDISAGNAVYLTTILIKGEQKTYMALPNYTVSKLSEILEIIK